MERRLLSKAILINSMFWDFALALFKGWRSGMNAKIHLSPPGLGVGNVSEIHYLDEHFGHLTRTRTAQ
jgi:hypothetical protein